MKKYSKVLVILVAIIAILAAIPFVYQQVMLNGRRALVSERNNDQCVTTRRVFDYADVLTDRQEKKLQQLIEKREKQLGLDIVIVTIDEDVGSDPYNASVNKTITFAEEFYEYFKFGYDGHISGSNPRDSVGAGVIYVDNWYDLDGYAESAFLSYMGASGDSFYDRAYKVYLDETNLLELENDVWEYSNTNPYRSYRRLLNHLAADMTGPNLLEFHIEDFWTIAIPLVVTAIFIIANLGKRLGKKTTDAGTYVQNGHVNVTSKQDVFLSKHTTKRQIETSSGGGGGFSGGGGGGGGHSGGGGRH